LATANHESVAASAKSLDLLLHDSFEQHQALARGTGAEKFIHPDDYMFGYKDKAAFQADAFGWNIRRKNGVEFEEMDAARLAEFDPLMAGRFGYGVRCPNHGRISDPGAYVKALAAHAEAQGATMVIDELQDVVIESGKVTGVKTAHQNLHADEVVLSAGIWSVQILKKLGLSVPMESERGYHIEFVNSSVMPKSPTMVASGKFVMTPMEGRLRCAGVVEFGGLNDKRSTGPLALLKRQMAELFPDLEYDRIDEWMGHRPSTIDSLPLIGQLDSHKNLWSAFGHQHIGLTGGPKTGWWIAKMIGGEAINVDLGRFDPNRF